MRLPLLLSALCALCIDCGATDESGDDLGVLRQALSDAPIVETFSGTLARNTTASRGPFAVQPGSRLSVVLSGTGDADLYVRFGSRPSTSVYDCRPYEDTSAEQCLLTVPASATTVYVDVRGYSSTSSYTLQIERVAGGDGTGGTGGSSGSGGSSGTGGSSGSSGTGGSSGSSGTGGSSGTSGTSGSGGSAGSSSGTGGGSSGGTIITETFSGAVAQNATASRGPFAVLPGSQLSAVLSGTGDADLYVRFGSRPSTSNWDCRPYSETAAEQCVLTVPANATTVYVDVRGYTASTYSLQIQRVAEAGSGGTGGSGGAGGSAGAGGSGQGNEPFVIAVLGSSTAEGEGASSMANSWVGLLESSLSSTANVSITNLAVGGYTTLELMSGSGASGSIDAALQEHPDLVVVALAGSNDQSMGTSGASYLSRLGQLRDKARAAGVPTFFVGTAPKDLSDGERFELADWNQQMRTSFSSCWVPASASYSPCFIDIFSQLADSDLQIRAQYEGGDGIHLNDAGHRVIFSQAVAVIEPYLCTVMDCR